MLDPVELFPEVPNLYEFPSVHAGMLYDEERVAKYSEAISQVVKNGDIVADIGTGTGLLSFLCLKAGAKRVHAIERSSAIDWAKKIAEKNGFSDKIVFHKQDSRDCKLPERVNVIVSELIGHIAFEEGMAESLFDAKERFLVADGVMLPERVDLKVALVEEKEIYPECIECWHDIEGIDFSLMRKEAAKSCYLTELRDNSLLSRTKTFFKTTFSDDKKDSLTMSRSLCVDRAGNMNGIALWFEAYLFADVLLSSGPFGRTHWRQCFAPLEKPMKVDVGDQILVNIKMKLKSSFGDRFAFAFAIKRK